MSSTTYMQTVFAEGVEFNDMKALNLELYMRFTKLGWNFNEPENEDGVPTIIGFDSKRRWLKFAGHDDNGLQSNASVDHDWPLVVSDIVAKHLKSGVIVQMFIWETERVWFHVIRPSKAETIEASEVASKFLTSL